MGRGGDMKRMCAGCWDGTDDLHPEWAVFRDMWRCIWHSIFNAFLLCRSVKFVVAVIESFGIYHHQYADDTVDTQLYMAISSSNWQIRFETSNPICSPSTDGSLSTTWHSIQTRPN